MHLRAKKITNTCGKGKKNNKKEQDILFTSGICKHVHFFLIAQGSLKVLSPPI